MDEFGSTTAGETGPVPAPLRGLFNHPDDVRVQHLPCDLPGLDSLAVHFGAGARTVPHRHHGGQHLVFVEGVGVVGDEDGVHVVRAGDVVSNPPGAWHWHGATPARPPRTSPSRSPATSTPTSSAATGRRPTAPTWADRPPGRPAGPAR